MAGSAVPPRRLAAESLGQVDDATLARTQLWLRFSPALSPALGTPMASPTVLWGLIVLTARP